MSKNSDSIVIVAATRTPIGGLMGALSDVPSPQLGAIAIRAAIEKSGINANDVDQVIMGCVLSAGLGQAPARQAALGADLPLAAGCVTINKMCGSGMKAVMDAHDQIKAGTSNIMVAGGMENMSRSPYLLPHARSGMRMGHSQIVDSMFLDGLEDAYEGGLMGSFAQATADHFNISREAMDDFAIESLRRTNQAIDRGWFNNEITPVTFKTRKGDVTITTDEQPSKAKPNKIPQLRPAFKNDGTITAANSSSISDGAAALILMSESEANARGLIPLARIIGHMTHAQKPADFSIAPISAIQKLLDKVKWSSNTVDLYEINEAFAVVTMLAMQKLELDPAKVNIHGGACALGHPIGCSGARVLVTLLHALKRLEKKRGIASLCIGGGEATAVAIEII
ncbi:acetyl-CoA C-acyltransferase [Marinomonas flavescens]|uniref:acetyl-CoA C-acyltransferase n=1 Tax=Marinomonas flavescens TaxID=2529379 RepID=UPI001A9D6EB8|nr:acetyl-CoA C-acyltransferase [Marinomonas flavescens]